MSHIFHESLPSCLAMFGLSGPYELMIVAGIVLLLFGKRIPSVMHSLGRSLVEFKKGIKGIEDDLGHEENEKKDQETSSNES